LPWSSLAIRKGSCPAELFADAIEMKWMLCDFYGKVLVPPTIVEHNRMALELAAVALREACQRHGFLDHIVAVEMPGTYHRPVQRAFRKAGSETRRVHPFASCHYRLAAHGDVKTDDHSWAHDLRISFTNPAKADGVSCQLALSSNAWALGICSTCSRGTT
jgi:hypothetical protein